MTDRIVKWKIVRQTSGPGLPIVIELASGYLNDVAEFQQMNQLSYTLTSQQTAALLGGVPDPEKLTRFQDMHDALAVILQAGGIIDGELL